MFEMEQFAIQSAMEERIAGNDDEQLETLVLSLQDYENAKIDEHEIRIDGKMYDVAFIELHGESVIVHCIHDTEEENLFAELEKFIEKQHHNSSATRNSLAFQFIQLLTISFLQVENEQLLISVSYQSFTHRFTSPLLSHPLTIEPPPPKMLM